VRASSTSGGGGRLGERQGRAASFARVGRGAPGPRGWAEGKARGSWAVFALCWAERGEWAKGPGRVARAGWAGASAARARWPSGALARLGQREEAGGVLGFCLLAHGPKIGGRELAWSKREEKEFPIPFGNK